MKLKYVWQALLALFLLIFVFLFIVIVANWNDQPLRPEVEAALNWEAPTQVEDGNGYLLLLGINAKEGVDPMQLGKRKLQANIERFKANTPRTIPALIDEPLDQNEVVFTRSVDETCRYSEVDNCVTFYLSRSDTQENAILAKQNTLLKNFAQLSDRTNYVEILLLPAAADIPAFAAVGHAAELERMRAIRLIANGHLKTGLAHFLRIATFSQRFFEKSESLISHMIGLAMVQHDLRIADELIRAYPQLLSQPEVLQTWLADFSIENMGIARALDFEGKVMLRRMQEILRLDGELDNRWAKTFVPFLAKPSFSVNLTYDWNQVVPQLLRDRHEPFDRQMQLVRQKKLELLGFGVAPLYLKNPITKILLPLSDTEHQSYIEKYYDTFAQINMLSLKLAISKQGIPTQSMAEFVKDQAARFPNPYDGSALGWDAQKQELFVNLRQPSNQLYRKDKLFRLSISAPSKNQPST